MVVGVGGYDVGQIGQTLFNRTATGACVDVCEMYGVCLSVCVCVSER